MVAAARERQREDQEVLVNRDELLTEVLAVITGDAQTNGAGRLDPLAPWPSWQAYANRRDKIIAAWQQRMKLRRERLAPPV